jgi:hypothetical protein
MASTGPTTTPIVGPDGAAPDAERPNLRILRSLVGCVAPMQEVNFLVLDNGDMVELVENLDDPTQTLLAICHEGQVRFTNKLDYRNQILVPIQRNSPELADVELPRGVLPYDSVDEAYFWLRDYILKFVRLQYDYVALVTYFIIYTWVADRLPVAVYLSLVGLPGSGKTTLLELLRHLCRRAVMVSDISISATSQICTAISATLLIDENDWDNSRGNLNRRQQLRAGTTQNAFTRRKGFVGRSFGPKVLTALEPPDDPALNRRCIQIPMLEANDCNLLKPSDPKWFPEMAEFQMKMLRLRFDLYSQIKPAVIPGAEKLRPGTRDLLTSLAAPFFQNPDVGRHLLSILSVIHDPQTREPLPMSQNAVVAALFYITHYRETKDFTTVGHVSEFVNWTLVEARERARLQPRKVGALLSSLGFFERVRTNRGLGIALNIQVRKRIHFLIKNFGNPYVDKWILTLGTKECEMCAEQANDSR